MKSSGALSIFLALFAFVLLPVIFGFENQFEGWRVSDSPAVQTSVGGTAVDRYGPTWLLRDAPDFVPDRSMQWGSEWARKKITPKTSDEISSNFIGVNTTRMPRSRRNDDQPLEAVHLIDGDTQTCWMSQAQYHSDGEPVWIRLDFPTTRTVNKVALVKRPILAPRPQHSYPVTSGGEEVGRGLSPRVRIETAVDGHDWKVVFDDKIDVSQERVEISFDAIQAKQIRVTAGELPICEMMYALSFAELEVLDADGRNVALISNGVGISASHSYHGLGLEIDQHRWLWPLQTALGAKWIRIGYHDDPINWHQVEKVKGVLEVDPTADAAISEMVDHGATIVMCLDFGNRLYSGPAERNLPQMWEWYWDLPKPPKTDEALAAWDRYVEYMVTKYKDRVNYFELWNEWDIWLYWGEEVSLEHYLNIAERTAAIVRRIAPNAKLLSGSVSGGGFPFGCRNWSDEEWAKNVETNIYLKMFKTLALKVDIIPWHPYYNPDPSLFDSYPDDVRALKKWLKSQGFNGKCMSTEWNVTMRDRPLRDEDRGRFFGSAIQLSELQKAKLVARCYLQDSGLDLASFFCEIYNSYHNADLSLMRRTVDTDPVSALQPQAAYYAIRNIAGYLDSFTPSEFDVTGYDPSSVQIYTFKTPTGYAAAIWKKGYPSEDSPSEPLDITINVSSKSAVAFDPINGVEQQLHIESGDGITTIRGLGVSDSPIVVRLESQPHK